MAALEEILARIKKRKRKQADDVSSAGFDYIELLPDGDPSLEHDLSPIQDANNPQQQQEEDGEISSLSQADQQERPNNKLRVTFGYHMVRGKRGHPMEDYVFAKKKNIGSNELGLYAIFYGHAGRDAAQYLQHNLFNNILNQPDFWEEHEAAVRRAYKETDDVILDKVVGSIGRSTAVTAILINREKLIVANVGDSRGIICNKHAMQQVTVDHEPESEKELVEQRGGFLSQRPRNTPRVDGVLSMTRAFGDKRLKEHISCEPHVRIETVGADAKFIVLASDGLWKVMSNDEVCNSIKEMDDAQGPAEQLVKEA